MRHNSSFGWEPVKFARTCASTALDPRNSWSRPFSLLRLYINGRRSCLDNSVRRFQHRYPVSTSTLNRILEAKRHGATSVYQFRDRATPTSDSNRGLRGDTCVAWLTRYVEQNCDRLPDVRIRLIPHTSLKVL